MNIANLLIYSFFNYRRCKLNGDGPRIVSKDLHTGDRS